MLSPTRGYCELVDKVIMPTDRGMQLASFLDRSFSQVISLDYTKQLEESLDAIAVKDLDKLTFLQEFYNTLETAIAQNKENAESTLQLDAKTCPNCGASMVIRRSRYGKLFYGCSQYPQCRGIIGID
jgi:DNA topoisomerase-1